MRITPLGQVGGSFLVAAVIAGVGASSGRAAAPQVSTTTTTPLTANLGVAGGGMPPAVAVRERPDLGPLGAEICQRGPAMTTARSWELGVYDAQIAVVPLPAAGAASLAAARQSRDAATAISVSRRLGYAGYHIVDCLAAGAAAAPAADARTLPGAAARQRWLIATHAPVPLSVAGASAFASACGVADRRFARFDGGRSQSLNQASLGNLSVSAQIAASPPEPGTIGIYCRPKARTLTGGLWFLLPTKSPLPATLPAYTAGMTIDAWINTIRAQAGLKPVEHARVLDGIAAQLPKNLAHDRAATQEVYRRHAGRRGADALSALGENKGSGASEEEILWSYWISPAHRDVLLHPEATVVGWATMKQHSPGHPTWNVLLTARRNDRLAQTRPKH